MKKELVQPDESFDWKAYEEGAVQSEMSKEDLQNAYNKTLNQINTNDVVEGTVISMNKREVVVNIGYKSGAFYSQNIINEIWLD